MIYDLSTKEGEKSFLTRVQFLIDKKKKVELTMKHENRTLSQNSYLHLILSWFAIEYGCTLEDVKNDYFKSLCNKELFVYEVDDAFIGKKRKLKSSRNLDTSQMTIAIDRFRNWSVVEAGIYLPEANEDKFLDHIQNEVNKHKQWL